ncbi:DUF6274 family protein [Streptomyces sp. NBC_00306]|uniref:DUF6274 family protein n=1 Tax=Streptomyces sp. NBC_00306 TaxID=2975708 RepID=UPI002E2CC89B|nr:DUF6274 family protein [Streptomyces sp. NBC_00306]
MAASTARRHETRALLRAHLAAASGYRHLTRNCPICHRLLRLAMEPSADNEPAGLRPPVASGTPEASETSEGSGSRRTSEAPEPAATPGGAESGGTADA